jgi:hypothetical protein
MIAAICLTLLAIAVLAAIRNEIAYGARTAALDVLFTLCGNSDFDAEYAKYEETSYESMMFDLTKWTFPQFYPSIASRLA